MLKLLIYFILFLSPAIIIAQTSVSDCNGAIVLCGDLYSEEMAPPGTGNLYEYTGVCNQNTETMSLWYTFTVQADGNLGFILTPNSLADDYDWGLFDITTGGCAGIVANGASPEVSCNSYGSLAVDNGPTGISTANGGTGNSNGPGDLNGPPFNVDLPVSTGQTFALVVMNWSNSSDGYTIDFSGSTATIYDDVNPALISIEANCGNNEFHIEFSENIINTTAEGIDFQIEGPGGVYTATNVASDDPNTLMADGFTITLDESIVTPGIYTLTVSDVSGYVEDACGNQSIDAEIVIELFAPLSYETTIETACNGVNGSISLSDFEGGAAPYEFSLNGMNQDDFIAAGLNDGNYTIQISDQEDCVILQNVVVPDNLISVVIPSQDTLSCKRPLVEITGLAVSPEQSVDYEWFYLVDGSYQNAGTTAPSPLFAAAGTYQVVITNTSNGCIASTNVELYSEDVQAIDLSKLKFPNVISPNGDSKNEYWVPFIEGDLNADFVSIFELYQLKIFNRWGKLVFDSENSNSRRWSVKDEVAGTYYYTLQYRLVCGGLQEGSREGTIEVIGK